MSPARRAQHYELEEGRKYFYGIGRKTNYSKAFPLLLAAAVADTCTRNTRLATRTAMDAACQRTSRNRAGGGRPRPNGATPVRSLTLLWIMISDAACEKIRERH